MYTVFAPVGNCVLTLKMQSLLSLYHTLEKAEKYIRKSPDQAAVAPARSQKISWLKWKSNLRESFWKHGIISKDGKATSNLGDTVKRGMERHEAAAAFEVAKQVERESQVAPHTQHNIYST